MGIDRASVEAVAAGLLAMTIIIALGALVG
jgi:hypothetical protein